ncbi:MAG: N-acetyl-gamma-glutamyl-phosphate reductase [Phycisphaerae bacterium]|nr:MAG: N-acetyl-gamma-glutamyl-phosphate reductase [Phycisphaerae bacterium]
MTIRAVVIGAGGYSGAELVGLLLAHPATSIVGLFASAKRDGVNQPALFSDSFGRFRGRLDLPVRATSVPDVLALKPDVVFLATPHEASVELARALAAPGGPVVLDLSAAFRLKDPALYPKHYGFEHPDAGLLDRAVYGLPELHRATLATAMLIAVPGCYPTSAILALAPLARAGAIARRADGRLTRPIVDSTSGVSGAGRGLNLRSLFCEVHQQPYGVLSHRHQPEIDAYAGVPTVFTPHLGPYERGILSTIHVELAAGWSEARVRETLAGAYAEEPFVRLCRAGVWPSVADVRGTNFCDLACATDDAWGHLILVSAIDNLVKGAAGQAVQCMNIRFGLGETTGLLPAEKA